MAKPTNADVALVEERGEIGNVPELGMMAWLASEGGRKCMWCGRYVKAGELEDCASGPLRTEAGRIIGMIDCAPMCRRCRTRQAEAAEEAD